MKFDQLIECNVKNVFLEKSCPKCDRDTIPRNFSKESKLSIISGSTAYSFIHFVFIVCQIDDDYRDILKLSCRKKGFWN